MDAHTWKVKTIKKLFDSMPGANSDRRKIFPGGHGTGGIAHCRSKTPEALDIQLLINKSR